MQIIQVHMYKKKILAHAQTARRSLEKVLFGLKWFDGYKWVEASNTKYFLMNCFHILW